MTPICPKCGQPATETMTKFGVRHDCCGLWSWGGKPLVATEVHEARRAAHRHFDALWKGPRRILDRGEAYKLLAEALGIPVRNCHISMMDAATALRVPGAVVMIRAKTKYGSEFIGTLNEALQQMVGES